MAWNFHIGYWFGSAGLVERRITNIDLCIGWGVSWGVLGLVDRGCGGLLVWIGTLSVGLRNRCGGLVSLSMGSVCPGCWRGSWHGIGPGMDWCAVVFF